MNGHYISTSKCSVVQDLDIDIYLRYFGVIDGALRATAKYHGAIMIMSFQLCRHAGARKSTPSRITVITQIESVRRNACHAKSLSMRLIPFRSPPTYIRSLCLARVPLQGPGSTPLHVRPEQHNLTNLSSLVGYRRGTDDGWICTQLASIHRANDAV